MPGLRRTGIAPVHAGITPVASYIVRDTIAKINVFYLYHVVSYRL